jgi:hypothetical protein
MGLNQFLPFEPELVKALVALGSSGSSPNTRAGSTHQLVANKRSASRAGSTILPGFVGAKEK